jgi:hypothetical protein
MTGMIQILLQPYVLIRSAAVVMYSSTAVLNLASKHDSNDACCS